MDGARKIASATNAAGETVLECFAAPNALSQDSDVVSQGLYLLSEEVIRGLMPESRGGGLGGEFGYGVDFENDVFMMHHYCWCERDDCKWCEGDAPNFLHKKSGLKIKWYKWIGRGMEAVPETIIGWGDIFKECWDSIPEDAHKRARSEQAHESTPEYKAAQEEGMRMMMEAMDITMKAMRPCYQCSMDENAFMVGGQTETGGGVKINTVTLDAAGACTNCGHVTTAAEQELLAERRKIMDASWREALKPD